MGKLEIIKIFKENVYGKKSDSSNVNLKHDGKDGHWLEKQMGIKPNRNNEPDLLGYEMKNDTRDKTTFGDWSATKYIYQVDGSTINRADFIDIFGKPNLKKQNRKSWSGTPIPTVKRPSPYNGSRLNLSDIGIEIIYNFEDDPRENKNKIVPAFLQQGDIILAFWSKDNLESKLTRKFGQNGWFRCKKNSDGIYDRIEFGEPITFDNWIQLVKDGTVFFDSGMYKGNPRNYSQWRANNNHWDSLVTETYPPFP